MALDKNTPLDQLPLDGIFAPIEGEHPTGEPLDLNSFSSPLCEIKSARDDAENAEKALYSWRIGETSDEDHERDWSSANWWEIVEPTIDLLSHRSKDLRAAAWLGEALVRTYGIAGLRKSLEICIKLCESYWDELHPRPDEEDGHTDATSALRRLFGDLGISALGEITFVKAEKLGNVQATHTVTFEQYRFIGEFDKITDEATRKQRHEKLGWVSTADWQAIAEQTPLPELQGQLQALNESVELIYELSAYLREHCQPTRYQEATSPDSELLRFRQRVEWMREAVSKLVEQRGGVNESANAASDAEPATESANEAVNIGSQAISQALQATNPATREEAFRRIEEIADFFEKQEPHSPVHFGLRQIVRWGRMSFPDLLRELLEDEGVLNSLHKRVGIPKSEST